jgi:hypothetical protein
MWDRDAGTEAEGTLKNAAGQVRGAARDVAGNLAEAGSTAYDQGSELLLRAQEALSLQRD